jgi:hypothetical protein
MATIKVNNGTYTLYFVESGGIGTGSSPTDSSGTMPAPGNISNNTIYILRRNSNIAWTISTSPTNSTDDLYFGIIGAPTSGQPFYDSIVNSAISGDGNLSTWLEENPGDSAGLEEQSNDYITFDGDRGFAFIHNVDFFRNDALTTETSYRFTYKGGTSSSNFSSLAMNNVGFLQKNYDMEVSSSVFPNGERTGIEFRDLDVLSLSNITIHCPTNDDYLVAVNGLYLNSTINYILLDNIKVYGNSTDNSSVSNNLTNLDLFLSSSQYMRIKNIDLYIDILGTRATEYCGIPFVIQQNSANETSEIENIRCILRKVTSSNTTSSISFQGTTLINTRDRSIINNISMDFSKIINVSDSSILSVVDDFGVSSMTVPDFSITVAEGVNKFPSKVSNISYIMPEIGTGSGDLSFSPSHTCFVEDVTAYNINSNSLNFTGNSEAQTKAKNINCMGFVSVNSLQEMQINYLEGIGSSQILSGSLSNVIVNNLVLRNNPTSSNLINVGGTSLILIDNCNYDVDDRYSINVDDRTLILVNSSGSGKKWFGSSYSYKAVTSNVYRNEGTTNFSVQFYPLNNSNRGGVWMPPSPFQAIQLTPAQIGLNKITIYLSTVNYIGSYEKLLGKNLFFIEVPDLQGTLRSYSSFSVGSWIEDNSTWTDPAVESSLGKKWRLEMFVDAVTLSHNIGIRFLYNTFVPNGYIYLDPVFLIEAV